MIVTRDKDSWPEGYGTKTYPTYFCGMNKTIKINGKVNNQEYDVFNDDLNNILNSSGFSSDIKVASNNKNGDSWDWIVIEIAYMNGEIVSRIFSGFKGYTSDIYQNGDVTNIEKMIG